MWFPPQLPSAGLGQLHLHKSLPQAGGPVNAGYNDLQKDSLSCSPLNPPTGEGRLS